jgi:hypothetical protein
MLQRPETRTIVFNVGEQKMAGLPPEKPIKEAPEAFESAFGAYERCEAEIGNVMLELKDPGEVAVNGFAKIGALKRRKAFITSLVGDLAVVAAPWMVKELHEALPFR